jgi:hypothetical protein
MGFGDHRATASKMPPVPAPPRPARPAGPARPAQSLPEDRDLVNIRKYADEFDAIPLPDEATAKTWAPVCNATNMNFIRSDLPMSILLDYDLFFQRMAKHQWRGAQPTVGGACWDRRVGGAPMGQHRPARPGADTAKPLYRGSPATDWKRIRDLDRINAYVFRGDKRDPSVIRAAGGFHPPSTRTDDRYVTVIAEKFVKYLKDNFGKDVSPDEVVRYIKGQGPAGKVFVEYEIWRAILESEKFYIGRMVADEFLRGFISTTRDARVAKKYATDDSADGYHAPTYSLYALHTAGGFLLPPRAQHAHGFIADEAEVAHPGSIPWREVMAFRTGIKLDLDDERTYFKSGVIFVRKGFQQADPRGYAKVVASLGAQGMMC